tara:strand:+ start:688 stop:909 length:222 start_codon:yes stop_codon:yes gene_type:complete
VPNDDKWKELQKIQVVRRTPFEKKLDNITKVIQNPDLFNVNIASRDRIDELEQRIKRLEELIDVQDKTERKEE